RGEVVLGAVEVGLEDGADVVVTALAQAPVDAERRVDVGGLLHVDPDEVAERRGVLDELGEVAERELLVDRETEMGELERDVRPESLGGDPVEQRPVRVDDGTRFGLVAHALAEERRVRQEAVVVQAAEDRHRGVEALACDEAGGAEPEAVALHEPLQPAVVGGREEDLAEDAQPPHSSTIVRTPARSSSVSPRSGARTSAVTGTPRSPSAVFEAAWNGNRCRAARSAVACSAFAALGSRTSATTASGKLEASPETAPAAPAARPRSSSASAPTKTSSPSRRYGSSRSHGLSETFIPARFGTRSRSRSIALSGIA